MTKKAVRSYRKFKGRGYFPGGRKHFYECLRCDEILSAATSDDVQCKCGNVWLDSGRRGVEDLDQFRVFAFEEAAWCEGPPEAASRRGDDGADDGRRYLKVEQRAGYPVGSKLFYKCSTCGDTLPSLPDTTVSCQCRNIEIGIHHMAVRQDEQARLFCVA